ncbi:hypothetical protein OPV22_027704 [Ensete ventricosum]|uniref:Uncharacterized protein n=1 Tax=Ensete ventricosum TaxID=4639 RepID=A0AAV8P384_ENSVE|nr:hypothetical protein OPV22_027704 [Ensete ventricosum]
MEVKARKDDNFEKTRTSSIEGKREGGIRGQRAKPKGAGFRPEQGGGGRQANGTEIQRNLNNSTKERSNITDQWE